jgi:hypothetical protein
MEPGKTRAQRVRLERFDLDAFGPLHFQPGASRLRPLRGAEDQITVLAKPDIGFGTEMVFDPAEKLGAE